MTEEPNGTGEKKTKKEKRNTRFKHTTRAIMASKDAPPIPCENHTLNRFKEMSLSSTS